MTEWFIEDQGKNVYFDAIIFLIGRLINYELMSTKKCEINLIVSNVIIHYL